MNHGQSSLICYEFDLFARTAYSISYKSQQCHNTDHTHGVWISRFFQGKAFMDAFGVSCCSIKVWLSGTLPFIITLLQRSVCYTVINILHVGVPLRQEPQKPTQQNIPSVASETDSCGTKKGRKPWKNWSPYNRKTLTDYINSLY